MASILFVCTANICRSPMAEALFRAKLEKEGLLNHWQVSSAGTWAPGGHPAAELSQEVMAARGLDISAHGSKGVGGDYLSKFDLILTMESNHKEALRAEFPEHAERIYMLSEMVGQSYDIVDPIGRSKREYEATATEIARLIEDGFERIQRLVNRQDSG